MTNKLREAGEAALYEFRNAEWNGWNPIIKKLEGELAEAVEKERERCALVCERKIDAPAGTYQILMAAAAAIRRGE